MTDCGRCWTVLQKIQCRTLTNVLWFGECLRLRHWKHLYSWERITQIIGIPFRIQKTSQWNKCSTYLRNWCPNTQMRSLKWKQLIGKALHGSIKIPAQENLLQKHKERVERLSQPDWLIKICVDTGFLTTVDVGQYFMTKHTDEFSQFGETVACREYTLPRDEKSTDPKDWIHGNTKIGPVLEVTTNYLQGEHGVEIRIWICEQRQFSLVGHNFSWLEQSGHRLDRQEVRRQRAGDLYNEDGSICVCRPIQS